LTPRRFQSGEMDYDGHISRRGDERLRALLYEAATVILTRVRSASALRSWALALKKRLGFKRAAVALARKLAVVLHVMWKTRKNFVWLVLSCGAVLTVGFTFFFGTENLAAQVMMTGILSVIVFLGLLVIVSIGHPFTGPVHV